MLSKNAFVSGFIAFLSLGFLSQSPSNPGYLRRISSTECINCVKEFSPSIVLPELSPFLKTAAAQQEPTDSWTLFSQRIDFYSRLNDFTRANPNFPVYGRIPAFPSYALPLAEKYKLEVRNQAPGQQIFSGLGSDPALQYLVKPAAEAAKNSVGLGMGLAPLSFSALGEGDDAKPSPKNASPTTSVLQSPPRSNAFSVQAAPSVSFSLPK